MTLQHLNPKHEIWSVIEFCFFCEPSLNLCIELEFTLSVSSNSSNGVRSQLYSDHRRSILPSKKVLLSPDICSSIVKNMTRQIQAPWSFQQIEHPWTLEPKYIKIRTLRSSFLLFQFSREKWQNCDPGGIMRGKFGQMENVVKCFFSSFFCRKMNLHRLL